MSVTSVLHVVPNLRAGGMEMALSRIVAGLSEAQGFRHTILVLKGEAIIRDKFASSVDIHCLHAGAYDVGLLLQLRKLILDVRPAVIHARNLGAWPEIAVVRLLVWPLIPLIFSFHGLAEAKPLPWRWRQMSRLLSRITSVVFTVSAGSKKFLTDGVGLSAKRVRVIPNGVDTERFYPVAKRTNRQIPVIATLGSLSPVKNQALLIKACHKLLQKGLNFRLVIAGEGPLRPTLENLIETLDMKDVISLPGHVENTVEFLQQLDIFVLPSDSEAHPNALSEAMSCGISCIGSRVGGIPEIMIDGTSGLLFEAGDEDGLAEKIESLLTNPQLREEYGAAARTRSCEEYSMNLMLERYRKLYLELY